MHECLFHIYYNIVKISVLNIIFFKSKSQEGGGDYIIHVR